MKIGTYVMCAMKLSATISTTGQCPQFNPRDVCGDHTRFHVCNSPSLNLSPERASCAGQREDQGEEPADVAPTFADKVNPTVSWFPSAPYCVFSESIALEIEKITYSLGAPSIPR
ncbi:hypothetical protein B0H13DRAFT_2670794, partial [Mycena leptocephala]